MERLSRVHANRLVSWAEDHPEAVVLSADLTSNTEADLFRERYPERFLSFGMTEQNMMSFAGGLAREGLIPLVHTFAVFIYRRALDQISMSIAYPNLRVRMFGFLPGITTPGGATHQATDDVGVLRVLPNMTIFETGDATEVETVLDATLTVDGPVYVRQLRGEIPRLFPADRPFVPDRARVLSEGDDLALLSTGICTEDAMRASRVLAAHGIAVRHLHVSTLKPFTDPAVAEAVTTARRGVVTVENHTVVGGLGTAVAEVMVAERATAPLVRLGLQDTYAHGASRPYLMREYGLDARAVVDAVEGLLGDRLGIADDELTAVQLDATSANPEAL